MLIPHVQATVFFFHWRLLCLSDVMKLECYGKTDRSQNEFKQGSHIENNFL